MGPKKKEEEIDLSTLPQCKSINAIILCRGKKARALNIIQKIQKEGEKFIAKIKKSQVLDHAKEKNIYVDPNTLNQKQKKDPKFMESINTELTAQVITKALKSLIAAQSVKIRLQKKSNLDKQIQDKSGRKYDVMYSFEDLPETKDQFEELAKQGENIKYVLVIDPKISWANAPQLPEEEEEEEDEEVKEYKQLLKKQQKTQEDLDHQSHTDKRINQIKLFRSQSKQDSQFRNCTISVIQSEIDPYNEQKSINQLIKQFLQNINKLNAQVVQYQEWKKDKHKQSLGQPVKVDHQPVQGKTVFELLNGLAKNLNQHKPTVKESGNDDDIMNLINSFSVSCPINTENNNKQLEANNKNSEKFVAANQYTGSNVKLLEQVRSYIKFPGINRYLMPQIPSKSQKLRKLLQSHYALFLTKNMDLNEYFRRQQILNFEQYIKQFDQERNYSFTNRIYEQHHNKDSLERQLYRALQFHEYNTFTKYDENTDKLYLMLVYKNNPRRVNKKLWESNWKVIPNYQSWLKYFKNNQNNLSNTQYFDIDYEKIGNIEENTRSFTLKSGPDGASIINKQCTVSNTKQSLLYGIKKGLVFGVQNNKFFGQNGSVRVYHLENKETKSYETVIRLKKQTTIRLVSDGNVIIQKDGKSRMITPSGYTILYEKDRNVILHPTGGITYNSNTYINQSGFGLVDGKLYTSPTLKRKIENGEIIKRDDNTVITNVLSNGKVKQKWIRFYQGTQYQIEKNKIKIQKAGEPFITCQNNSIRILTDQISIRISNNKGEYTNLIQFFEGSELRINNEIVQIFEVDYHEQVHINIKTNEISSSFDNQEIKVRYNQADYIKNGKKYDARQQEEKYGEDDVLPSDYIEPRLFIINNDNTGFELISENMYKTFLKERAVAIDKVYQKKNKNYVQCHIIGKQGKSNGKFIKNPLQINLDVFNNTNEQKSEQTYQYISLKTLLKYEPLTSQNINELQKIKVDVQNWRKQIAKDQNQYGHKQASDSNTKGRIQAKLLTIKKRQEKEVRVKTQALKETAKNFHIIAYEEILKQAEKQNKEKQLRSQFMKKKNSIVQEYKRVSVSYERKRKDEAEVVEQFMDHYFMTSQGKHALSEMPQWVFRPKQIKESPELDPQIRNELNNTNNLNKQEEAEEQRQRYDTVEVNLNPKKQKQIYIKPSVFTQRQIDQERYAFQHQKKAYKYHEAKRKDFNVYGNQRKSKPEVPTLLRTQPISQINQKYLVTEAPLDKKVKISSMKNKLTSSASNMVEMRKEGPHTLLMRTIDKGNDINKLLQRRTMMVQADLNDKLQRDVLINPIQANFGVIIQRRTYELKIQIKNEDVISQRITIKRPKSVHAKAQLTQMGPIAMGMTRKISVILKASSQILGKFSDQFDIVTKHQIYHIPINAHIISESQSKNEGFLLSRGVTEVEQNPKKKNESFELPRIK